MIYLMKKRIQMVNDEITRNEQLRVNAENEYHAMSCGAFNPILLARIKRSKPENYKDKCE